MAEQRVRNDDITGLDPFGENNNVVPPNEPQKTNDSKYDSMLELLENMSNKMNSLEARNKEMEKKLAEASGDISENIKESKRKYGFNIDGTRNTSESFKYRYNVLVHENKEKVVISVETIGRPVNTFNPNTGKWNNVHNLTITFSDKTKTEMDILDYINQKYQYEEFVKDEDIQTKETTDVRGNKKNTKFYTFDTAKFGKFTVAENFINN